MRPRVVFTIAVFVIVLCHQLWAADNPQSLAIRAGKIWTVTDGVITDGIIVIKDHKIDAVGKNLPIPEEAKILEMADKHVIPGLVDAHCHLGLSLDIFGEMDETVLAVTPDMQILDAFNPLADRVKKSVCSGVTTVLLAPGNKNPIAGQTAVVKLGGSNAGDWVLKRGAGIKLSVGNEALMSTRQPTSRAGMLALIREELDKAKDYTETDLDPCAKILKSVVEREMPVYIYCDTVDEVVAALKVVEEYELNAALVGAREADEVAEMISERNIPVIYMPSILLSKDKELKRVGKLAGAGVKVAFSSFAPRTSLNDLRTSAIIAVKYGLSREIALRAVTINAAETLGIAQAVGSVEKGKDADLAILDGDPLELTSRVEMVIVNGNILYQREEK